MDQDQNVRTCVTECESVLSECDLAEVRRLLDHGEREMAFEGLILELMKSDTTPDRFVADRWRRLGAALGLEDDSVFDAQFWSKFVQCLNTRKT